MKSRIHIIALLFCLSASSISAAPPIAVKDYVALRTKIATNVPIATIKADAGYYIGKVMEIRGMLTGTSSRKDSKGASIIISTEDGSYSVTVADNAPTETPGAQLACLVKIGERSTLSLSDLRLVACTYMAELDRLDVKPVIYDAKSIRANPPRGSEPRGKPVQHLTGEELVTAYKQAIKRFNPRLSERQADTIARSIIGFSLRYKMDARLVCAVIIAESHFRIDATSRSGAQGLGQLMPSTAAGLGVNDAYDPVQNIYGSVRYVKGMLDRMSGNKEWNQLTWYDLALALAAYNAGPNAVKRHGGVPPYKETQNYVRRVTSIYKQLCGVKLR